MAARAAAFVCLILAPSASGAARSVSPIRGGTLVVAAEQEPSDMLNMALDCCVLDWGSWIEAPVLLPAFEVRPDYTFAPRLVARVRTTNRPFTVTYVIRKAARWNDGVPVTAQDFVFTWRTWTNPDNQVVSRDGYADIRRAITIDAKTVKFVFAKPYAPYKLLFAPVLPRHALLGEDFNRVWEHDLNSPKTGKPIADGPFQLDSYTVGSRLALVRNERWWGRGPHLDRIVVRFLRTFQQQWEALGNRGIDLAYPSPRPLLTLGPFPPNLRIQSRRGLQVDRLDFNLRDPSNPLTSLLWVRQAVAYALNRPQLTAALFRTINPGTPVANSLVYVPGHRHYRAHFARYASNLDRALSLFTSHGCTRDPDGVAICGGTRLALRVRVPPSADWNDEFELLRAQLHRAGIDSQRVSPAAFFFPPPHDLTLVSRRVEPDPHRMAALYCFNFFFDGGSCDPRVERLLAASDGAVAPRRRAQLVNDADALLAADLPSLPLFARPTWLAFRSTLHGVVDNPAGGPLWNAEDWWLAR